VVTAVSKSMRAVWHIFFWNYTRLDWFLCTDTLAAFQLMMAIIYLQFPVHPASTEWISALTAIFSQVYSSSVFMMVMLMQQLMMKIRGLCSHVLLNLYSHSPSSHLHYLVHLFRYASALFSWYTSIFEVQPVVGWLKINRVFAVFKILLGKYCRWDDH